MSNPNGKYVNKIITGDCVKVLAKWPEGCADLVFADPPFNIGYDYNGEYHDKLDPQAYVDWCGEWMQQCHRILKPNGSFFLAIGDEFAAELKILATKTKEAGGIGFHIRNWIIWHYRFGQNSRTKFARSHAHIFYLVKNPKECIFSADAVRVMSGRQKNYADKRAYHTLGKVPDDVWDEFPRVCGTFQERDGMHPCQMPEAILARIIRACSNPESIVVDPFAGSGTTLAVAKKLGRGYLGVELSISYAQKIRMRLRSIEDSRRENQELNHWPEQHVDTLNSLFLETGVPLDRLIRSEYLGSLFAEQLHVRIELSGKYSVDEIIAQLQHLRKSGKLSRTLVQDDGRSYAPAGSKRIMQSAPKSCDVQSTLFA